MSRSSLSSTDCLLSLLSVSSCQARSARDVTWTVCQTVNCLTCLYTWPLLTTSFICTFFTALSYKACRW